MQEEKEESQRRLIHADPTKDFFVTMITRDIALQDCIFDLLDNSIDGARRKGVSSEEEPLKGYFAKITFNKSGFSISDNCGGIRLSDAIDYAFHFGRRPKSPSDVSGGIGLYGIGMKRAIFKIGKLAKVISNADDGCFEVSVDVVEWQGKSDNWDFEYQDAAPTGEKGTTITITNLNPGIDTSFDDPVFKNELIRLIARDYAFFISKGFEIKVNEITVPYYKYQLRQNDSLAPAAVAYEDDGVYIRIVAGLIDDLPDEVPDSLSPKDVERYGWYVVCNDRIVLAADKDKNTIWGDDGFRMWHPQYNGFAGFVFFQADDQAVLPWTTTKRDIDRSNPLYRRTLVKLKEVTEQFIKYTNQRKNDLVAAKLAEKPREQVDVYTPLRQASAVTQMRLPSVSASVASDPLINITYKKRESEIKEIRQYLSRPTMTYREIGLYTFDYFMKMELGK